MGFSMVSIHSGIKRQCITFPHFPPPLSIDLTDLKIPVSSLTPGSSGITVVGSDLSGHIHADWHYRESIWYVTASLPKFGLAVAVALLWQVWLVACSGTVLRVKC